MTCCNGKNANELAQLDRCSVEDKLREEEFRSSSIALEDKALRTTFVVPDMHCVACISKIEKAFHALPSVINARANLSTRRVQVDWNAQSGSARELSTVLTNVGFKHSLFSPDAEVDQVAAKKGRELLLALAVAGFAAANIMLLSVSVWSGATAETAQLFHMISGLIAVPAVAIAGRPFFRSAWSALSVGRLNMDVPISLAVLLALSMGLYESFQGGQEAYFDACVMLLFFLLIGRTLDHMMREKANGSIASLAELASKGGLAIQEDGSLEYVKVGEIQKGMKLRVMPGERFPVDAVVTDGTSDADRSLVTGESDSVLVQAGDTLEAGTLNLTGPLDIEAKTTAEHSFLADIMKMMEAAQNGRGHYVRLAEKMATIYAPAVHLLAFITLMGWMFVSQGDWKASIYAAIAVLIITCPCALGLAVPVVHVVGANRLFKQGILMRDGSALERLAEVDTVAFDKTGTLTEGRPRLVNPPILTSENRSLLAQLAARSSHPSAKALANWVGVTAPQQLQGILEIPGFGVEASYHGKSLRLGRPSWASEYGANDMTTLKGATSVFWLEGSVPIPFFMRDKIRDDAAQAVGCLQKENVAVEILSGDHKQAVLDAAEALNISNYQHALTPQKKVERLEALARDGHKVLMLGDGLNDAPSLVAAHVSMAPASASEIGRLAADYVFTRDQLMAVPFALETARKSTRLIKQNFGIAIAYNCIAVPLAMAGLVTPLIAALAMSGSSIVVVANSMRLHRSSNNTAVAKKDKRDKSETTSIPSSPTLVQS